MYSVICGHDKSAPYSGCTWCKCWCTRIIRSVHSVGVGEPIHRARPHELYKYNHASQLVYVDKRWCTWVNITCSWNKHWSYINNSSVHSVGVGDRFIAPVHTNCINAITHHSGCTWVNVGVRGQISYIRGINIGCT